MATPYLPQHFFFVYPRLSFFVFLPLFFWACQVISALALFFLPTITLKRNLQRYQQWPFREKRGHESDTNSFSPVLGMQGLFEQAERPMRSGCHHKHLLPHKRPNCKGFVRKGYQEERTYLCAGVQFDPKWENRVVGTWRSPVLKPPAFQGAK